MQYHSEVVKTPGSESGNMTLIPGASTPLVKQKKDLFIGALLLGQRRWKAATERRWAPPSQSRLSEKWRAFRPDTPLRCLQVMLPSLPAIALITFWRIKFFYVVTWQIEARANNCGLITETSQPGLVCDLGLSYILGSQASRTWLGGPFCCLYNSVIG